MLNFTSPRSEVAGLDSQSSKTIRSYFTPLSAHSANRLIVKADTDPLKRWFTRPSILFDAKEAADIDIDTLFNLALSDGQAAKDEMQGVIVYDYELNIGWGKLVSLPSQSLPASPPGQMAIRSKEGATVILSCPSGPPVTSVPSQNSELVLTPNVPDDKGLTGSSSDLGYNYGKFYAMDGATHVTCGVLAAYLLNNLREGATDCSSCATVMLELARGISQWAHGFKNSVIFLFNTREDEGLNGAHSFITQHPWSRSIHMAIDLEAMGDGGASAIFQAGPNPWAIENYALVAKYPSGKIFAQDLFTSGVIKSATDFQVYKKVAGLSGLDFAYADNTAVYHIKNDKLKLLKPGSLEHLGENVLTFLLHSVSSSQLTKMASNNKNQHDPAIYFDILGTYMVVFKQSLANMLYNSVIMQSMMIWDFTVPNAVNDNVELYCKTGVPFVMGTTSGDRDLLYKTVEEGKLYAVISPQMGKQVVAFLTAMDIMSKQFPRAFSGHTLEVLESHQSTKLDTSRTAKAISCFQKLGVSFDIDEVQLIRDPKQ
ncbi:unnamed protein product [Lactuca saligna]|uniref:Vacuolar membrane protease n=1 Tax=Lactuca saligna TaxID=75948 RepID=A0AA35UWS6_LACSI|nr:unnamed protein product [Lactuca saligna]